MLALAPALQKEMREGTPPRFLMMVTFLYTTVDARGKPCRIRNKGNALHHQTLQDWQAFRIPH